MAKTGTMLDADAEAKILGLEDPSDLILVTETPKLPEPVAPARTMERKLSVIAMRKEIKEKHTEPVG